MMIKAGAQEAGGGGNFVFIGQPITNITFPDPEFFDWDVYDNILGTHLTWSGSSFPNGGSFSMGTGPEWGTVSKAIHLNLNRDLLASRLEFDTSISLFHINGPGFLMTLIGKRDQFTLNPYYGIVNDASVTQTVNMNVMLDYHDQTWSVTHTSGVLRLTPGSTLNLNGRVLTLEGAGAFALEGAVTGAGSISRTGGTLRLRGVNTFTGPLTLNQAVLDVDRDDNFGVAGQSPVLNGSTLRLDGGALTRAVTYTGNLTLDTPVGAASWYGVLTGAGQIIKTGAARLTLGNTQALSGGLLVSSGVLAGNTDTLHGPVVVAAGAELAFAQTGVMDGYFSGSISGAGSIRVEYTALGYAVVRMAAGSRFTHSGETFVTAGTALVAPTGEADALGSASMHTVHGVLDLGGAVQTVAGLAGAGEVYSVHSSGVVGTLVVDGTVGSTFAGTLKDSVASLPGGLSLVKRGSGTLSLTGANTFTGGTRVEGGALEVRADAALGGAGGALTLDGGTLRLVDPAGAPYYFSGTHELVVGSVGGTLDYGGSYAEWSGGINGSGGLTITGAGELWLVGSQQTAFTGTMTVNAGVLILNKTAGHAGNNQGGALRGDLVIQTGGHVSLRQNEQLDDARQIQITGGTLDLHGMRETTANLVLTGGAVTDGGGGGGVLVLRGNVTGNASSSSSLIQPELDLDGAVRRFTVANGTAAEDLVLGGRVSNGTLVKAGSGTLVLAAANAQAETQVQRGTLIISSDTALGAAGAGVVVTPGSGPGGAAGLRFTAVMSSARSLAIQGPGLAQLTTDADVIWSGTISGAGGLSKFGAGKLTLTGFNSHLGATNVNGGVLAILHDAALGAATATLLLNGGTLLPLAPVTSTRPGFIVLDGTIDTSSADFTWNGIINSFSGGLIKNGAGTLRLGGANTFVGGLTANAGTTSAGHATAFGTGRLTINAGAAAVAETPSVMISRLAGSGMLVLAAGASAVVGDATPQIFTGEISGGGAFVKSGSGTLTLTGTTTHGGGTTVAEGSLAGSITAMRGDLNISAAAVLRLDQGGDASWEADVTGAGSLELVNTTTGFGVVRMSAGTTLTHTGSTLVATGLYLVAAPNGGNNTLSAFSAHTVEGTLDLSGLTQTIGSLAGGGQIYSYSLSGATGTLVTHGNDTSTNFTGVIRDNTGSPGDAGRLAVVKEGLGTLTLSGVNTFSGGLTVKNGAVEFATAPGLGSAGITLDGGGLTWAAGNTADISGRMNVIGPGGATFDVGTNDVVFATPLTGGTITKTGSGKLTVAGLRHAGATHIESGILESRDDTHSAYGGVIIGSGSFIKSGVGTLTFTHASTHTGGTTVKGGLVEFSAAENLGVGSVILNGGGLRWAAGASPDISSRLGALGAGGGTLDVGANNVTFANDITGTGVLVKQGAGRLTLPGLAHSGGLTLAAGELEVRVTGSNDFAGGISGAGGFIKSGGGTLTLTGISTHTGGTAVTEGTLVGAPPALAGDFSLGLGATLRVDQGVDAIWQAAVTGSGNLELVNTTTGFGVVRMAAGKAFTHSGGTYIGQNTWLVAADTNAFSAASGHTIDGVMDLSGTSQSVGSLAGSGQVYSYSLTGATGVLAVGGNNASTTFTGLLRDNTGFDSGRLALVKNGSGTLALGTPNTYSGGTTIRSGSIIFTTPAALGTGAIMLDGGGLKWAAGNTADISAQLGAIGPNGAVFDVGVNDVTFALPLTGSGTFTKTGAGRLTLVDFSISQGIHIDGGQLEAHIDQSHSFNGGISGSGTFLKTGTGTLALTGVNTFTGTLELNEGTLTGSGSSLAGNIAILASAVLSVSESNDTPWTATVSGEGRIDFIGAPGGTGILRMTAGSRFTHSGSTLLLYTGLVAGDANSLSPSSAYTVHGSLDLNGTAQALAALFGSGQIYSNSPVGTLGTLSVGGGNSSATFSGRIKDNSGTSPGILALVKLGTGFFSLRGVNSFSGGITVRGGLVDFSTHANLGEGNITLDGGGLRWRNGSSVDVSVRLNAIGPAGGTFDVGTNNVTFNSVITGAANVIKAGTGTLTLAAGGSVGSVTVSAGTLRVNDMLSGAITVQDGATLGGSGVLGYVTLQNGATLAPGNSPGTLTLAPNADGSFDFQSGSTVLMEITLGGGPSDLLNFIGNGNSTLSFHSSLSITANTLLPTQNQTFNLLDWSGLLNAPTFATHFGQNLIRDGSQDNGSAWDLPDLSGTGFMWDLSQFTTNGTIQIVPEPSRAVLLMLGTGVALCRRRRAK